MFNDQSTFGVRPDWRIGLSEILKELEEKHDKSKGIIWLVIGTRLYPLTIAVSKQLLPIYDKLMVLSTTVLVDGIRDILTIITPEDQAQYQRLMGDGSHWGINLQYSQLTPEGLAQALFLPDFAAHLPQWYWRQYFWP